MAALIGIPSSEEEGSDEGVIFPSSDDEGFGEDPEATNEDVSKKMKVIENFLTDIQQIAPTIFKDPKIEFFEQDRRKRQAPGKHGIFLLW